MKSDVAIYPVDRDSSNQMIGLESLSLSFLFDLVSRLFEDFHLSVIILPTFSMEIPLIYRFTCKKTGNLGMLVVCIEVVGKCSAAFSLALAGELEGTTINSLFECMLRLYLHELCESVQQM